LDEGATVDGDGKANVSSFLLHFEVDRTTFRTLKLKLPSAAQKRIIEAGVRDQDEEAYVAHRWEYLQLGVPLMRYHGVTWTKIGGLKLLPLLPKTIAPNAQMK
jgi:hypothetical protein